MSSYRNKEVSDEENTVENDEDITPANSDNGIEENDEQQFYPKKLRQKTKLKTKLAKKEP